jgi:hypothetical protein
MPCLWRILVCGMPLNGKEWRLLLEVLKGVLKRGVHGVPMRLTTFG